MESMWGILGKYKGKLMSEFYKQIRDDIIKKYKYLGIKEKISFYCYRLLMILMIILLVFFCPVLLENTKNWRQVFTVALMILVLYIISKYDNKKYQENKKCAVIYFTEQKKVPIEAIEILILETDTFIFM